MAGAIANRDGFRCIFSRIRIPYRERHLCTQSCSHIASPIHTSCKKNYIYHCEDGAEIYPSGWVLIRCGLRQWHSTTVVLHSVPSGLCLAYVTLRFPCVRDNTSLPSKPSAGAVRTLRELGRGTRVRGLERRRMRGRESLKSEMEQFSKRITT